MQRIAAPMLGGMITAPLVSMVLIPVLYIMWRGWQIKRGRFYFT
jgi:Cu(I)/Ag(I) efflux system membrane protein CusA/SilA